MFALGAIAGLVMAVPSLVLGITAFVQIARNSEKLRGKGLAAIGTSAALVVLGMTVSLLVPNIGPAREEARRMNRRSDLRQIHAAFEDLAMNNGGFVRGALCDGNGGQLLSWRVALLPYLGQESLYREFRLDEPWDSEHNQKLVARMPNIFGRPEDSLGEGMTCYAVPVGPGTLFASKEFGIACRANLEAVNLGDGRSNTVMVVVMPPNRAVLWTKPEEFTVEPLAAWEALRGAREVVVLTCDGAVHTVSDSISSKDFAAALTIAAGDTVPFDMWQE